MNQGKDLMYRFKAEREMHRSYNVSKIIDFELNPEQTFRARNLFVQIWSNVNTWSDLEKIEIDKINFGISIIRDYLRWGSPTIELKTNDFAQSLWFAIQRIVFLFDYFQQNKNIKTVILWDGVGRDSFLRDIAIANGIPTYLIHFYGPDMKGFLNFHFGDWFKHYKDFFNQLSPREQKLGMEWAKRDLNERLQGGHGDTDVVSYMKKTVYSVEKTERVLARNNKLKVLICPHAIDDDLYCNGWQIFSGMIDWLDHLGKLSNQTNYDWYLKLHPIANERDQKYVEDFLQHYPNIKLIPTWTSPKQLKEEGIKFAFTIWGTIGHEYPALGIQVINAGNNPHIAFDFDLNPRTEEEFNNLVLNLEKVNHKIDIQEIYKFYCVHFLYYEQPSRGRQYIFSKNPDLNPEPRFLNFKLEDFFGRYEKYLEEWTPEFHELTKKNVKKLFKEMNNYRENIFYKKAPETIKQKLLSVGINVD